MDRTGGRQRLAREVSQDGIKLQPDPRGPQSIQGTHQGLVPRGGKGRSPSSSSDSLCHRLGARGGLLPGWPAPVWPGQSFGGRGSCQQPIDTAATQERLSGLGAKRSHSPGTQPRPPA